MQPLIPDVLMRPAPDGGWTLELNPDTLPRVLVNQSFYARVGAARRAGGSRLHLPSSCRPPTGWCKSLQQRAQTILKVASEIVRQQDGFFRHGVAHLRPLILRDIAAAVEMHESTVSRVTANKYIATPRGTFELKYFFTTAINGTHGGEAHSAEAVRHRIRGMIGAGAAGQRPVGRRDRFGAARRRRGHRAPDRGQIPRGAAHPELGAAQAGEGHSGVTAVAGSRRTTLGEAMQITVSGKQVEMSDALRERVAEHLDQIAGKYFDHALEAVRHLRPGAQLLHLRHQRPRRARSQLRGEGEAADAHAAFDDAAEHIAKRLRRYRRRVNEHARDLASRARPEAARQYVLAPGGRGRTDAGAERRISAAYATVIADKPAEINRLSVGEAVMQLDLADRQVMMFRNSATGEFNVIYRRSDGHIGWIDPSRGE